MGGIMWFNHHTAHLEAQLRQAISSQQDTCTMCYNRFQKLQRHDYDGDEYCADRAALNIEQDRLIDLNQKHNSLLHKIPYIFFLNVPETKIDTILNGKKRRAQQ